MVLFCVFFFKKKADFRLFDHGFFCECFAFVFVFFVGTGVKEGVRWLVEKMKSSPRALAMNKDT